MKIVGFTEYGGQEAQEELLRALDLVPPQHLEHLDILRYSPKPVCVWGDPPASRRWAGIFYEEIRSILVMCLPSDPQFREVLFHEIGHHVFHRILTADRRYEWVMGPASAEPRVSRYARKDQREDFAECYMYFLTDPERLAPLELKHAFLRDHVFGQNPPGSRPPASRSGTE